MGGLMKSREKHTHNADTHNTSSLQQNITGGKKKAGITETHWSIVDEDEK